MSPATAIGSGPAACFFKVSLVGLVFSGYLALAGSGSLRWPVDWLIVHLLFFLAVARTLTARAYRHYVYVKVVAFLELLAAALLSRDLTFFVFLAAFLLFLVATLASAEVHRSTRRPWLVARGGLRRFHWRLGVLTLFVSCSILALTGGLFFVLPRTAHAAFNRLVAEHYRLPGFSGEVRLGQIGAILERNTPVMRFRVVDASPSLSLKWRGAALGSFDGKRWSAPGEDRVVVRVEEGRTILADDEQRRRAGSRLTYEVRLETIAADVLFFAGVPEVLWIGSPSVTRTAAGVYGLGSVPRERVRYGAIGYLDGGRPGDGPPDSHARGSYLQLPDLDRRIPALALQAAAGASSDNARALALEGYLRRSFAYSTRLPQAEPADPLANFLFDRREGHCEYFASSMAVMLRTLGIPARMVVGFQGSTLNPVSGWYVVRASHAHSWVEAWIADRGWTTFDPTPPRRAPRARPFWSPLFFYMDTAEMFWQDWVVDYDIERQLTLASRMESSGRVFGARWLDRLRFTWLRWQAAAARLVRTYGSAALLAAVLAAAAWLWGPRARSWALTRLRVRQAQHGAARASDATLLYARMLHLLKRRGYRKPPWLTPGEFASTLPPSPTADLVARLTSAYHELRYGGRLEAAPRMAALLDQLEHVA